MASVGAGMAGVGLSVVSRSFGKVRAVCCGGPTREGGVGRSGSFRGPWGTDSGARQGWRMDGGWGSTWGLGDGVNGMRRQEKGRDLN
jgi:hypothetical protein